MINISTQLLPFTSLIWNTDAEIIAAGYDCEAFKFRGSESGWENAGPVAAKARPGLGGAAREESALQMFRQMDLRGKSKDDTQLSTTHQNTINTIRVFEGDAGGVKRFSSSGVDGRVVIWNI